MGKAASRKAARKFVTIHELPLRKRRALAALEARLNGEQRAELRRAIERDVRDGKLEKDQTHLAAFCKKHGI